jgi:ArsR family transcriptional regulator, virulence genes transcriptional regulator
MALVQMCAWVDSRGMDEIEILQAEIMRTLANPRRLRIIHRLAGGPVEVGRIAADLGISQPNVSQHLAVMRAAGVVEAERAGREVRYRLADPGIVAACELMRGVLTRRLDRLAGLSDVARLGAVPDTAGSESSALDDATAPITPLHLPITVGASSTASTR